jgi:prolyl oligopeptidase
MITAASSSNPNPKMGPPKIEYPVLKEEDVVEEYHGTQISDPFRWLENPDSEDVKQFVDAQNAITVRRFFIGS